MGELINREAVEMYAGKLTEEEWRLVVDEINGRVENYIEEIIDQVVEESRERVRK